MCLGEAKDDKKTLRPAGHGVLGRRAGGVGVGGNNRAVAGRKIKEGSKPAKESDLISQLKYIAFFGDSGNLDISPVLMFLVFA